MRQQNRLLTLLSLLIAVSLSACGGAQSKSGGKELSAYDELGGISESLQQRADELMSPITESDAIITEFTELPKALKLKTEDFKSFIISAAQGEIKAPAGASTEVAAKLTAFGERFVSLKEGLESTPDRALELGKDLAAALVKVPVLVTKVDTQATVTKNNPFASAADKAKATRESAGVKAMGEKIKTKIKGIQTQVVSIPGKATSALGKLAAALKNVGIANLSSLKRAPKVMVNGAVKDVKNVARDAAKNASKAVQ